MVSVVLQEKMFIIFKLEWSLVLLILNFMYCKWIQSLVCEVRKFNYFCDCEEI